MDAEPPIEESWYMQIRLLEKLLGIEEDSSGYSTLLWWIQEQEFGAIHGDPIMHEVVAADETFDFSSIHGIYDFLVREVEWTREKDNVRRKNNHSDEEISLFQSGIAMQTK